LSGFIDQLGNLGLKMSELKRNDLASMAVGLALLALFVVGLGLALRVFSQEGLQALPDLTQLIQTLGNLGSTLSGMSGDQLMNMGIGLAILAAFVWALAAALVFAQGPLMTLEKILSSVERIISSVTASITKLVDALSNLGGGLFGDMSGLIGVGAGGPGNPLGNNMPAFNPAASMFAPGAGGGSDAGSTAPATAPAPTTLPGAPAGPQPVNQAINLGGITVSINAERLEANAAHLLSDQIVQQLQQKLVALLAEQGFRAGARPATT
jgi:hypothetical protein